MMESLFVHVCVRVGMRPIRRVEYCQTNRSSGQQPSSRLITLRAGGGGGEGSRDAPDGEHTCAGRHPLQRDIASGLWCPSTAACACGVPNGEAVVVRRMPTVVVILDLY
jgi:hypothetical protein